MIENLSRNVQKEGRIWEVALLGSKSKSKLAKNSFYNSSYAHRRVVNASALLVTILMVDNDNSEGPSLGNMVKRVMPQECGTEHHGQRHFGLMFGNF
jgi:hypothetical protein